MADETEWRLRVLEGRLDAYHEWLEASLAHDRRFQLDQTWAVSGALVAVATAAAALYAAQHWLAIQGWLPGTIAAAGGWIGATFWARWAHRENERKLSNLPQWGAALPLAAERKEAS